MVHNYTCVHVPEDERVVVFQEPGKSHICFCVPYEWMYEGCDPDSSSYTWENLFKKIYTEAEWDKWGDWNFEKLHRRYPRYCIYPTNDDRYKVNLAGDTDFNFGSTYARYLKLINKENSEKKRENMRKKLQACSLMHHSLENFSIMPVTGGLNSYKGLPCGDRIDKFIYLLNDDFTKLKEITEEDINTKEKLMDINIETLNYNWENIAVENKKCLYKYLKMFIDITEESADKGVEAIDVYCEKIYKLPRNRDEDKKAITGRNELVTKLLTSGEKEFNDATDVDNYMNLAIEFWKCKQDALRDANEKRTAKTNN